LKQFSLPKVVSIVPATDDKHQSPREQLANQVANIFEMQRQAHKVCSAVINTHSPMLVCPQLKEDVGRLIASNYPGGVVSTKLTSFTSPQFTKV